MADQNHSGRRSRSDYLAGFAVLVAVVALFGSNGRFETRVEGQGSQYFEVSNVTDLRAAVTALSSSTGGGTIRLRPGLYELGTMGLSFANANNVSVVGSGVSTDIHYHGSDAALTLDRVNRFTIRDLTLSGYAHDSHTRGGTGIRFPHDAQSNNIQHCLVHGFSTSGIRFEGASVTTGGALYVSSNRLQNSELLNNGGAQLYARNFADFYIVGNQFGMTEVPTADAAGVRLEDSGAGTYTMNYHWGNRVGLTLTGRSNFNRIENNRFEESLEEGIRIQGPTDGWPYSYYNIISGNTIHTNSRATSGMFPAVSAEHADHVVFTSNQILSWDSSAYLHSNAIHLKSNCRSWIIRDNILTHSAGAGQIQLGTADVSLIVGLDSTSNIAAAPAQLVQ